MWTSAKHILTWNFSHILNFKFIHGHIINSSWLYNKTVMALISSQIIHQINKWCQNCALHLFNITCGPGSWYGIDISAITIYYWRCISVHWSTNSRHVLDCYQISMNSDNCPETFHVKWPWHRCYLDRLDHCTLCASFQMSGEGLDKLVFKKCWPR